MSSRASFLGSLLNFVITDNHRKARGFNTASLSQPIYGRDQKRQGREPDRAGKEIHMLPLGHSWHWMSIESEKCLAHLGRLKRPQSDDGPKVNSISKSAGNGGGRRREALESAVFDGKLSLVMQSLGPVAGYILNVYPNSPHQSAGQ